MQHYLHTTLCTKVYEQVTQLRNTCIENITTRIGTSIHIQQMCLPHDAKVNPSFPGLRDGAHLHFQGPEPAVS